MEYDAVIIVQARMESTRLPEKVLKLLAGKPLILQLLERLKTIPCKNLITAISNLPQSKPLETILKQNKYNIYKGHPTNVYQRFLKVLKNENAKAFVRVTADNPLTDIKAIKSGITKLIDENLDYLWMDNCPKGLGCDIFKTETFKSFGSVSLTDSEKEHVVPIFRNRPNLKGSSVIMPFNPAAKNLNFSIDTEEEYLQVKNIFERFYAAGKAFDINKIINSLINNK